MNIFKILLSVPLLFVALTTIIGSVDMILYPSGVLLSLHPQLLANSPFSNFLLPGLISLVFIGGSSLMALLLIRDKSIYALPAALFSGIAIVICASCVVLIFKDVSWVAVVYWVAGLQIVLSALYIQMKYDSFSVHAH
ncbi:MAG TPA: hypothetical protein VG738_00245 [Chitinophagaceae bacterium]|nr:hypothetical protein [Chitinophagaceae bacterium]